MAAMTWSTSSSVNLSGSSASGLVSVAKGVRNCLAADEVGAWMGLPGVLDARVDDGALWRSLGPEVRGVIGGGWDASGLFLFCEERMIAVPSSSRDVDGNGLKWLMGLTGTRRFPVYGWRTTDDTLRMRRYSLMYSR